MLKTKFNDVTKNVLISALNINKKTVKASSLCRSNYRTYLNVELINFERTYTASLDSHIRHFQIMKDGIYT